MPFVVILDTVGISLALLKGMENILPNSPSNSRGDNLNSAIIVATVINVSPEHLANLKEPVILRFKHLKVRDSSRIHLSSYLLLGIGSQCLDLKGHCGLCFHDSRCLA